MTTKLQDPAVPFTSSLAAFKHVAYTKSPVYLNGIVEGQTEPLYVISEQAYKYLISSLEEDEKWDLGWLGQSEQHAKKVPMPEAIKRAIQHHQQNKGFYMSKTLYAVTCHEVGNLSQLSIATSTLELFNKLKVYYDITEDEFDELLSTRSLCKYLKVEEEKDTIRINLFLATTEL